MSQVFDEIIPSEAGCYSRFATTQYVKLNIPGINHSLGDHRENILLARKTLLSIYSEGVREEREIRRKSTQSIFTLRFVQ